MAKVGVVGGGAWGTAIAAHATRIGHDTRLWAVEPEVVEDVNTRHENSLFLSDVSLPDSLTASTDPAVVMRGVELVILVPPSKHLRAVSIAFASHVPPDALVAVATKGIEESSLNLLSTVLTQTMPAVSAERLAFLSGPTFAREVALQLPADIVAASVDFTAARRLQPMLHSPHLRVYASDDPIGVQVGGAVKNVLAIATGVSDGLGLGANARAAIITRGLAETTRLGVALGANPLTFLGLAGVGDLVLTATGDLSRNRTLGKQVAAGADPAEYLSSRRSVAEGYLTSAAAWALAQKLGVDMPITEQVYRVLHERQPLERAVRVLMERAHRDELHGIV
jgi:glycerol-3-phosphate dehydrogenase (NAD(P)+)